MAVALACGLVLHFFGKCVNRALICATAQCVCVDDLPVYCPQDSCTVVNRVRLSGSLAAAEHVRMPLMPDESFQVAGRAGANASIHILSVRGAMTYSTSPAFHEAVRAAVAPDLIIDLSEVPSLDSVAIGALVRVFVSYNKSGRKLALVGLNHRVRNVLQIAGVDPLFDTYATISEAESALN
jgi:anti-sigma B factor antagonist